MKMVFSSKGILKDILIVVACVGIIWLSLYVVFGTQNPFYVVASGSMIPVLQVYDVLVVQGHEPFENIIIGDIIVFDKPATRDKVIVHRVVAIIDEEPRVIRTRGDANPSSIPGTDFPITDEEYIGKVAYVIPQVGYFTQLLKPPVNYIIIVIVIGAMIIKQILNRKNNNVSAYAKKQLEKADIDKIQKDPQYVEKTRDVEYDESKTDVGSKSDESKTDSIGSKSDKDVKTDEAKTDVGSKSDESKINDKD